MKKSIKLKNNNKLFKPFLIILSVFFFLLSINNLTHKPFTPKEVLAITGTLDFSSTTGTVNLPGGIWNSSGYVGIGTTDPQYPLEVVGDINVSGSVKVAGVNAIPAGTIIFFNLASCPTGWSEVTTARGRAVVGLPSSGTLAGTVGTALADQATITITSVAAHTHTFNAASSASGTNSAAHTHTIAAFSGGVTGSDSHTHSFATAAGSGAAVGAHTHAFSGSTSTNAGTHTHSYTTGTEGAGCSTDGGSGAWQATVSASTSTEPTTHTHTFTSFTSGNSTPSHTHTIANANSSSAGVAHTHTTGSLTGGNNSSSHSHSVDYPSMNSASTGDASVDVTMPYIQLLVCQKS